MFKNHTERISDPESKNDEIPSGLPICCLTQAGLSPTRSQGSASIGIGSLNQQERACGEAGIKRSRSQASSKTPSSGADLSETCCWGKPQLCFPGEGLTVPGLQGLLDATPGAASTSPRGSGRRAPATRAPATRTPHALSLATRLPPTRVPHARSPRRARPHPCAPARAPRALSRRTP